MVELFTWSRTDGYSIVKPEIKNKVEIPEMLPHKCATEVLAETEKFVEPIDNYSAGKKGNKISECRCCSRRTGN